MQMAAADPKYVRREDVPAGGARAGEGRSTARRSRAPASRPPWSRRSSRASSASFYERVVLLDQPSIRDAGR